MREEKDVGGSKRCSLSERSQQSYPEVLMQQKYLVREIIAKQNSLQNNFSACCVCICWVFMSIVQHLVGTIKMRIGRNPFCSLSHWLFWIIVQSFKANRLFVIEISQIQFSLHLAPIMLRLHQYSSRKLKFLMDSRWTRLRTLYNGRLAIHGIIRSQDNGIYEGPGQSQRTIALFMTQKHSKKHDL